MMTVKKIKINTDNEGRRIDNFLISILQSVPRSKIYNIIRKGEVRVNSSRIKPSYKLKIGDQVRIPPNLNILDKNLKSIKPKEITNLIKEKNNVEVVPSQIILKQDLNKTGLFKVDINFHSEVKAQISIKIDKIQSK